MSTCDAHQDAALPSPVAPLRRASALPACAPRRCVSAARFDAHIRALHPYFDFVETAVARMGRRIVAEHVVTAVGIHDSFKRRRHIVGVDRGDTAGLLGSSRSVSCDNRNSCSSSSCTLNTPPEAPVTPLTGVFVPAPAARDRSCRPHCRCPRIHEFHRHAGEPAWIDRVEVHIGARRRRNGVLGGTDDNGRVVGAEHITNRIVEAPR